MEELEARLCSLNIGGETGVLLDLEQLKHKSMRQHVECPGRLQSIFSHLTKEDLLKSPSIELVNQLRMADRAIIEAVHDPSYVDFIESMWPEETKKKEIFIVDTYFNDHSAHAAYLGAGATLEAIDKVIEKRWKNAFCVIRPPGHHAGHSRTCTGFCFFNNVAIGTKYLQNHHGVKKVLILDWDIHHGDGTQHIFKDDPNVLFISLHRYDDGSFYPNSGSVENQGEGAGKGFKVNIPWDTSYSEEAQKAGTDEYIYAFERIAAPIIKEFQPEFVMISAGFDSAEGDPLGQCKLTYEGYSYMTRRLMEMMKGRNIVVCLEGGYNLDSISWASEAVLRTLTGEPFPLPRNARQLGLEELRDSVVPNSVGFSAVRKCLKAYIEHWPCLKEFGNSLDQRMIQNVRNKSLISAGHQSSFQVCGETILKKSQEREIRFYKDLQDSTSPFAEQNELLKKFLPKLQGFKVIDGCEYVMLQNLTFGLENGSIIDFKLGKSTKHSSHSEEKAARASKKDLKTTSCTHGYKICGVIIKDDIGIPSERIQRGNLLTNFKFKDVVEYTTKVFGGNILAIDSFVMFLVQLLEFFETKNTRSFVSNSIIVIVDNTINSFEFKLIDFNYVDPLPADQPRDENIISGVEGILQFMKIIQSQAKAPQKQFLKKK